MYECIVFLFTHINTTFLDANIIRYMVAGRSSLRHIRGETVCVFRNTVQEGIELVGGDVNDKVAKRDWFTDEG